MRTLERWKFSLYGWAMARDTAEIAGRAGRSMVEARTSELIYYMYRKGAWSWLRGSLHRFRFRQAGRRLFLGRRVEILFPGYLSVGDNVSIGRDSYLNCLSEEGVRIGHNVRLKEHLWLQVTSHLTERGKGIAIGDNCYVGPYCVLGGGGGVTIGSNVTLGAGVDILAENHRFEEVDRPINRQGVIRRGIVIEDDCWIGNRAIVLDGLRVGRGSVIGAAAVVTRDLPPFSVAVGNPARVVRSRQRQETGT
ncbi:MAG: acyltransferase [Acidobacteria bacterium]|nr:acyltransferase [Acidobacteriota bacterium]